MSSFWESNRSNALTSEQWKDMMDTDDAYVRNLEEENVNIKKINSLLRKENKELKLEMEKLKATIMDLAVPRVLSSNIFSGEG